MTDIDCVISVEMDEVVQKMSGCPIFMLPDSTEFKTVLANPELFEWEDIKWFSTITEEQIVLKYVCFTPLAKLYLKL